MATLALFAAGMTPEVRAQNETTASGGGSEGTPYTLSCHDKMILVGIRGKSGMVLDSMRAVCSRYNVDGFRVGSLADLGVTGGGGGVEYERLCPSNSAVTRVTGSRSGPFPPYVVTNLGLVCMDVRDDGLHNNGPGTEVASVGALGGPAFDLPCAHQKFARAVTGRSGAYVDSIALVCNRAELAATRLESVSVGTSVATTTIGSAIAVGTSGSSIAGTVSLNGYALNNTNVNFGVSGAQGASVATITIPANQTSGTFQLASTNTTAGCARVTALSPLNPGQSVLSGLAILTPPRPSGAGYSFTFVNPPAGFRYLTTLPVDGRICFGTPVGKSVCPGIASEAGTVTFSSSAPNVVSVPAAVTYKALSTSVPVPMTAGLSNGCAIVTATRNGVSISRTAFVDVVPQ